MSALTNLSNGDRELAVSAADFQFLQGFLRSRAAIELDDGKEYLVQSRLLPLVRERRAASIADVIAQVRSGTDEHLRLAVLDLMTTNETSFFRDVHPFEALRSHIIPELLARPGSQDHITVWCAAASSGQEPYSVAMLLSEHFPSVVAAGRARILATDLSPTMVERARVGRYSQLEVNRGLPASLLVRYLRQEGTQWCVRDDIRSMVEYREMNLATPWVGIPHVDLVLMRNVLIYFSRDAKRDVLRRLREVISPGGRLLMGSSETTLGIDDAYERCDNGRTITYRPIC